MGWEEWGNPEDGQPGAEASKGFSSLSGSATSCPVPLLALLGICAFPASLPLPLDNRNFSSFHKWINDNDPHSQAGQGKTGYIICGVWCNMKMQVPLFKYYSVFQDSFPRVLNEAWKLPGWKCTHLTLSFGEDKAHLSHSKVFTNVCWAKLTQQLVIRVTSALESSYIDSTQ